MAAAETASAAGTRRPVVRSERFVQWQQQLSSSRRAPCGTRRQNDDRRRSDLQKQQKESEERIGLKDSRGTLDGSGEENKRDVIGISQKRRIHQQPSIDCNGAERASPLQFYENGPHIVVGFLLCNGQQSQQEQQLAPFEDHQGRCTLDKDHELQLRMVGEGESANGLVGKRYTRLHTRIQGIDEPPPPPLKLPKLHVALSRKEVLEDWIKMTGQKYTGKPKKSALAHLGLELCTSMTCASTIRRYLNIS